MGFKVQDLSRFRISGFVWVCVGLGFKVEGLFKVLGIEGPGCV